MSVSVDASILVVAGKGRFDFTAASCARLPIYFLSVRLKASCVALEAEIYFSCKATVACDTNSKSVSVEVLSLNTIFVSLVTIFNSLIKVALSAGLSAAISRYSGLIASRWILYRQVVGRFIKCTLYKGRCGVSD